MDKKKQSLENRGATRPNRYAAPVGAMFIILAIIGFCSVVYFCFDFTMRLMDDSDEKAEFERVLLPVLMFDPAPFENVADVDPNVLLRSSLWSALTSDKAGSFQYDNIGRVIVPQSDVDLQCARLFGTEIKLEHQSFYATIDVTYVYDSETKSYHVPTTGEINFYTPSVDRVVKTGDIFTLTVGYMPPLNVFTQLTAKDGWRTQPEKYMLYEMQKIDDYYQLKAIRDLSAEESARLQSTGSRPIVENGEPVINVNTSSAGG